MHAHCLRVLRLLHKKNCSFQRIIHLYRIALRLRRNILMRKIFMLAIIQVYFLPSYIMEQETLFF